MTDRPSIVLACVLAVGTAACRTPTYEAEGDLVAVDAEAATIAHPRVGDALDPATTRFVARPAAILAGARPGTRVRFQLQRSGGTLVLTSLAPIGMAKGTTPGAHDDRPLHGGVVTELGGIHVEVAATPDGRVRAYLTDLWRRPLPVAGTTGTVRLSLPDGPRELSFVDRGDALEAGTSPFATDSAPATVVLVRGGERLEMNVLLDLTGKRAGLASVPQTGCIAVDRPTDGGRVPRCVITFAHSFSALATTPDGARLVVAVSHDATSVWRLPDATLQMGIEPPPPVPVLPGAHEPDARGIAFGPGGDEVVVAIGSDLVFSEVATGRFRRKLAGPGGMIQALGWAPDGALVVATGDGTARVLAADDGHVLRTLPMDGQVVVVAIDAGRRWIALGNDVGGIGIVELAGGGAPRVVTPSLQPVAALGFAGDRLVSAGTDGTLRAFDPETGRETDRFSVGTPLAALAIAPDGRQAVTADNAHELRIHSLPDGAIVDRSTWHQATIGVVGWGAGGAVVSGDNDGKLAIWDVAAAR